MYDVGDILGLTMYSKTAVPVYSEPWDVGFTPELIPANSMIGVVWSFYEPKSGRSRLMWGFQDQFGQLFFTPHEVGMYNLQALRDQGLLDIDEKKIIENYPDWYEASTELISNVGSMITKGILLYLLARTLPKIFK